MSVGVFQGADHESPEGVLSVVVSWRSAEGRSKWGNISSLPMHNFSHDCWLRGLHFQRSASNVVLCVQCLDMLVRGWYRLGAATPKQVETPMALRFELSGNPSRPMIPSSLHPPPGIATPRALHDARDQVIAK